MTKKIKQWYFLTEDQLWKLVGQGTHPDAAEALEEFRKIKEAGETASIYYSEFDGFRVINESNPDQMRIGLSISSQAKRFSM